MTNNNKKLSNEQHEVLIGLLLSDAYLEKSSQTSNARFCLQLTVKTQAFFNYCYDLFKSHIREKKKIVAKRFAGGPPKDQNQMRTVYNPVFTDYHNLFYITKTLNGADKTVKVFPTVSYLVENLSDKGLAMLLMGDGSRKGIRNRGYEIHTQGHDFASVARLCLALYEKFDIESWPTLDRHNKRTYWVVYISANSFENWRERVTPLFKECGMVEAKLPKPLHLYNKKQKSTRLLTSFMKCSSLTLGYART